MDLSPLNALAGKFDGAPSLTGFSSDSYQPGQRVRGNTRLFAQFYNLTSPVQKVIPETVKKTPLSNGVVREDFTKDTKWSIEPETKLMVRVIDPGDKYNIFDGIATEEHMREFYAEYDAFLAGKTKPVGTALNTAPFITSGLELELNRINIHTLEQLESASDAAIVLLGSDNFKIREQAKQWLDASESGAEKKKVRDLEEQVKLLGEKLAAMGGKPKKGKDEENTITA